MTTCPRLTAAVTAALILSLTRVPGAAAQEARVGIAAWGGVASPSGDAGAVYDLGGAGGIGFAVGGRSSPLAFRAEGMFVRLAGTGFAGIDFPAVKIIGVFATVRVRLKASAISPYLLAGAGTAFAHHNFNYDEYAPYLAGHAGLGVRLGRGRVAPVMELRYLRTTGPDAPIGFVAVTGGISIGRF